MNKLKFRAYHKAGRKMYEVTSLSFGNDGLMLTLVHVRGVFSIHAPQKAMPDELELMQYTGLQDKNGKEIWEGDIVACLRDIGDKNEEYDYVVDIDLESPSFLHFIDDGIHLCEVIGNIYETPQLLQEGHPN